MHRTCYWTFVLIAAALVAQTKPPSPHAAPASKRYCQPDGGFCFRYPTSWGIQGQVFDGNGIVIAPSQQPGQASEITVALVMPPPEGDEEPPSIDSMIEQASKTIRESGQDFQTLQRQRRTVDNQPAELLKVRYRDKDSGQDWIEEIIFIDGPDDEIYSIALKCPPQDLARAEPVFARVVGSWALSEAK